VGEHVISAARNGLAVEVGAPVTICIRPEKIHVLASGATAPEGFSIINGVVDEHFFHGSAVRMAVTLGAGVTCIVDLRLDSALGQSSLPEAGSSVTLVVDPANVIVFAAGGPT
jgi:ABC-type Fe3+/spermidine/putrescine transport system ATPase subunit